MKLTDVHAQLTDERFDDVENVIERAKLNGVFAIISAGCDLKSSQSAIDLAKKFDEVFAVIGIHPQEIENLEKFEDFKKYEKFVENLIKNLKNMAKFEKIVGIGEIGLDYHYFDGKEKSEIELEKNMQKFLFEKQIELANELDLPIVVHTRDAVGDTIEMLKKLRPKRESVIHCFGGSVESAKILKNLNFSFSFGGVATFKNAKTVVEVIESLDLQNILLETDSPYLAPVPFRSERNEPKNVVYVADKIAKIKGVSMDEVADATAENVKRIFGI